MQTRNLNLISIDPGAKGAIVVQIGDQVTFTKMPTTQRDVWDTLAAAVSDSMLSATPIRAYCELVGGFIGGGDGGNVAPPTAMFSFGEGFGGLTMALTGLKVPFELVRPQRWQKALSLGNSGMIRGPYPKDLTKEQLAVAKRVRSQRNSEIKRAWKNKLKAFAQQLFPYQSVTLDTCDALLLLHYARKQENVEAPRVPQTELSI